MRWRTRVKRAGRAAWPVMLAVGLLLALGVRAEARPRLQTQPLTATVLVVDVSSSMDMPWQGGIKLNSAQAAAHKVVAMLRQESQAGGVFHRASLVTFSSEAYLNESLTSDYGRLNAIKAELKVEPGAITSFSPAAENELVRVVQEALTNVRKHARASHVTVRFENATPLARIVVEDDGLGFATDRSDRTASPRFGMRTMAERMSLIGGEVKVQSARGRGTRVIAVLPAECPHLRHGHEQLTAVGNSPARSDPA